MRSKEDSQVTTTMLTKERIDSIEKKVDEEIRLRKSRVDPTGAVRPGVLFCLENLSDPKLIAGIIDEPAEDVQAFVQFKLHEQLKSKLSLLLKGAMSLPVRPGLEDEFQRILAVNLDSEDPDWVSGAGIVEALLEIGEALSAGEKSEKIAAICARLSSRLSPRRMSIVFGWLENYIKEGKEFLGWLKWYREEQRRSSEKS